MIVRDGVLASLWKWWGMRFEIVVVVWLGVWGGGGTRWRHMWMLVRGERWSITWWKWWGRRWEIVVVMRLGVWSSGGGVWSARADEWLEVAVVVKILLERHLRPSFLVIHRYQMQNFGWHQVESDFLCRKQIICQRKEIAVTFSNLWTHSLFSVERSYVSAFEMNR